MCSGSRRYAALTLWEQLTGEPAPPLPEPKPPEPVQEPDILKGVWDTTEFRDMCMKVKEAERLRGLVKERKPVISPVWHAAELKPRLDITAVTGITAETVTKPRVRPDYSGKMLDDMRGYSTKVR